jgi:raffinose/stachyose/melibiose transport system permease protein
VALPLTRGAIRTAVVLGCIGSLKYFDLVWVMTEGGPSHASELLATYMYKRAFEASDLGYGSAIATALFMLVMLVGLASVLRWRRAEQPA